MTTKPAPPPFIVRTPTRNLSPFIFSVPHSGRYYPPDFTSRVTLDDNRLRQSEDAFVDKLFEGVGEYGGTLLVATHARAYLDLNRAADELDPQLFTPALDEEKVNLTHRVRAGLGLIPRVIAEGVPIYSAPLPAREATKRGTLVHAPYHQKLASLIKERQQRFGVVYLVDCHSMPSEGKPGRRRRGPDIVLGDCWGTSCDREFTSTTEELLMTSGFRVRRNVPYSGGYTTVFYGRPDAGIHALQIEISRGIYMDERRQSLLSDFGDVRATLLKSAEQLIRRTKKAAQGNKIKNAAE